MVTCDTREDSLELVSKLQSAVAGTSVLRRHSASPRDRAPPRDASPIMERYDSPDGWNWCYVDETEVGLSDQTAQVGPILRYV